MRQFFIVCGNMLHRLCLVSEKLKIFLNKCVNLGDGFYYLAGIKKAHNKYGLLNRIKVFKLYVAFN